MRRLFALTDAPKALLPAWLLAVIVLGATFLATASVEIGVPAPVAAAIAAAVSWGCAGVARVRLARQGRTGYTDMPSADYDYNASNGVQLVMRYLGLVSLLGPGVGAGALAYAAGLGRTGTVWVVPPWLAIGVIAAFPVVIEADARYGLWVRRRRLREEEEIRTASSPPTAGEPIVVPLARDLAWLWAAGFLVSAAFCAGFALVGDEGPLARVMCLVAAPICVYLSIQWLRYTRAPHFLRAGAAGVDLLGAGEIPWSAIEMADINESQSNRWVALTLAEPVSDQAWATPAVRRFTKRSNGARVELPLRLSEWPASGVAAALRDVGHVRVEAFLA